MKIHCIIQARFNSSRLPGKILKDIGGRTILKSVYDRCWQAWPRQEHSGEVFVALHGVDVANGAVTLDVSRVHCEHEEPAARFLEILHDYKCDGFVRVCADSPFIDPEVIDEAAQAVIDGKDYFLAGHGLMHGNQAEGFNTQAFLKAEPNMQGDEREHLGLWFQRRDRLTVDTPADLERARLIVSRMTKPHTEYTAAECLELLRNG